MRYTDILTESREYALLLETPQRLEWLIKNFGEKVEQKFHEQFEQQQIPENVVRSIFGDNLDVIAEIEAPNPKVQKAIIEFIMNADPTNNKAYARWIVLRYLKNNEKLEDMGEHLSHTIGIFAQAANSRRINGNIDAYKTFAELTTACEPFLTGEREVSGKKDRKAKRDTSVDTRTEKMWTGDPMLEQATVILDSDAYMILTADTPEAAAYFGKNTHWCTTSWAYERYAKDGPLIIILRRSDSKRWQFHFESHQFMDELDRAVSLNEWIDENKEAFDAIGPDRFAKLIGLDLTYGGGTLSMRHFTPEVITQLPPEVLVKTVSTNADIDHLPPEKALTTTFFGALLKRMTPSRFGGTNGGIDKKEVKPIINRYLRILGKQDDWLLKEWVYEHDWLLKELPTRIQTDDLKETVAQQHTYNLIDELVPKPWPDSVDRKYWYSRAKGDHRLRAIDPQNVVSPEDVLPEKYLGDDDMLASILSRNPEDIKHFVERLTPKFCQQLLGGVMANSSALYRVLSNLPDHCLTKNIQVPIYKRAMTLKLKSEQHQRDGYLKCLTCFHNDHWPWKASTLSGRMAVVNPDFYANPEQFHTHRMAVAWAAENPKSLHLLGPELVTEEVVKAALTSANANREDMASFLDDVLDPCDVEIVKPTWVAPIIEQLSRSIVGGLKKVWQGIPKKYLERATVDALLRNGDIPFDHEHFPDDAFTGDNILARFKSSVDAVREHTVTREEAEAQKKANGYVSWGHKISVLNTEELKAAWESLPEHTDRKEALKALFSVTGDWVYNSRGGGHSLRGKDFHCLAMVVEEEYLDDPEVLTAWLDSIDRYRQPEGPELKTIFKKFPKSAYTPDNMALAVEKGILSKVPHTLQNDDVIATMFVADRYGSNKEVLDFSKLTPKILLKALKKEPYDFGSRIQFATDKQTKILDKPLSDLELSLAVIKRENLESRRSLGLSDDTVSKIYERPARRVNWTQECYDLTAGDIVPLENVPEKFRSEAAVKRAVKTTNTAIAHVEDKEPWLNEHGNDLEEARRKFFLSLGLAKTKNGWKDFSKREDERTKVKGCKGSYAFVAFEKGEALMVFDDKGKPVNAILDEAANNAGNYYHRTSQWANTDGAVEGLSRYRLLLAAAFEERPDFVKNISDRSSFERMKLFSTGDNLVPIEKWPRESIDHTDLSYVSPSGRNSRWNNSGYYMFVGDGPLIGWISLESSGRGTALQHVTLHSQTMMPKLLELSNGFATFLEKHGVASGQNSTFKESPLFTLLGIRGPGRGVWFSLLEKKVHEEGDFTVWTSMTTGTLRVSVAHAKHGILTEAKKLKRGDFSITYLNTTEATKLRQEISDLYEKISDKV